MVVFHFQSNNRQHFENIREDMDFQKGFSFYYIWTFFAYPLQYNVVRSGLNPQTLIVTAATVA